MPNTTTLEKTYRDLLANFTNDETDISELWAEIVNEYSEKSRHYHNLSHLENMLTVLAPVLAEAEDADTLLFALFYHDIVYSATAKNNEEKSADVAAERLNSINYPADKTARCLQHIIATKNHLSNEDNDTNILLDADLSILGADTISYKAYCKNIRKEYSVYPDFLYKPGRKKVVKHFLEMDTIFKTEYFRDTFETSAIANLKTEYDSL